MIQLKSQTRYTTFDELGKDVNVQRARVYAITFKELQDAFPMIEGEITGIGTSGAGQFEIVTHERLEV